jgi:serine/threonine protein kinase
MMQLLRFMTVRGDKPSPDQKADAVVQWLVDNGFMIIAAPNRASQIVRKFYGHETDKSKLFESDGVFMNATMPWLKNEQVAAIRTLLIDRVHANRADPNAATATTRECLVLYFCAIRQGKIPAPMCEVHTQATHQPLVRLSAFHMDDVFFDPSRPLAGGQQGSFYAGVTRKGYPVGVKRIHLGGEAEAKAMRHLQVGGYLQVHYGTPPDPTWVVMPCYSGTLSALAPLFLEVSHKPRSDYGGGLIGARYILRHLLGELAVLHDEMHGLHQDIKSSNIFVSQKQQRFVLGDLGLSSRLSARGDAAFRGLTYGYASPEQAAESEHITPASDVFSLCVTAINIMLQLDPTVRHTWARYHVNIPRATNLFPPRDRELGAAFAAWGQFSDRDDALQQITEDFELTYQGNIRRYDQRHYEHFNRIDQVMNALDAPLWDGLRSGLKMNPKLRPTAKSLQKRITMSQADTVACEAVWPKIAPYSSKIDEEIKRLVPLVNDIR